MTPAHLFTIANLFAGIGWLIIFLASPFWKSWDKFMVGIIIAVLALTYTFLNLRDFSVETMKDFGSLSGVMTIFQKPDIVNAAWTHILAMDLMVATWIKMNSLKLGIKHWMILPALLLTLVFGPFGFILYLLTRLIVTKQYFATNAA